MVIGRSSVLLPGSGTCLFCPWLDEGCLTARRLGCVVSDGLSGEHGYWPWAGPPHPLLLLRGRWGGGPGAEPADFSLVSHPIPGLRQLLSCHLIDKTLGRPLSLLFLSKRTPRAHFSQDPAQKKAVLLFSGWWFLS